MPDESLLREPADRGVRLVALSLLADAHKAARKLAHANDDDERDDALHDFRVAVRRFRSWLRAFEPWVDEAVSRKRLKRLHQIANATGAARDAAVHLEWMRHERGLMGIRQRIGEAWLRDRLDGRRAEGMEDALAAAAEFDTMAPKLERKLASYRCAVVPKEKPSLFGAVVSERLRDGTKSLRRHLSAIRNIDDVDHAHRARIAAKRFRYVFESVADLIPDGDAIIEALKSLQDSLGDLHDVHVFSKEVLVATEEEDNAAACPGLLRLARRLEERGARAYADVEAEWLHGAGAPLFAGLRDLAEEVATSSRGP
ncbi:MAG: domain containing protein [Gemmatimonadetes bacterium]|nr:domain containing protein [Gemmatimonadota bacterium]